MTTIKYQFAYLFDYGKLEITNDVYKKEFEDVKEAIEYKNSLFKHNKHQKENFDGVMQLYTNVEIEVD